MRTSKTTKPATAETVNRLEAELLGGVLDILNTQDQADLQARRLRHLFAVSYSTASTIASLVWGVAR